VTFPRCSRAFELEEPGHTRWEVLLWCFLNEDIEANLAALLLKVTNITIDGWLTGFCLAGRLGLIYKTRLETQEIVRGLAKAYTLWKPDEHLRRLSGNGSRTRPGPSPARRWWIETGGPQSRPFNCWSLSGNELRGRMEKMEKPPCRLTRQPSQEVSTRCKRRSPVGPCLLAARGSGNEGARND
jgi:hypothetical protein